MTWTKVEPGEGYPMMPYNPQTNVPAALQRPAMAPLYFPNTSMASMGMSYSSYAAAQMAFPTYDSYGPSPTAVLSPLKQQYQERPQLQLVPMAGQEEHRRINYSQDDRRRLPEGREGLSIKSEELPLRIKSVPQTIHPILSVPGTQQTKLDSPIDALMKNIQSKPDTDEIVLKNEAATLEEEEQRLGTSVETNRGPTGDRRAKQPARSRYRPKKVFICDFEGCGKVCRQKNTLKTHMRSHTGEKHFFCHFAGCGRGFSQPGNLNTHIRRHTGEKPFVCSQCHKAFPQRANLTSHKRTHLKIKPFKCLFDNCPKSFTERGNLKLHQNKFHLKTIHNLMVRFSKISDWASATEEDRKWVDYLAPLYKNLNKGIKGRGRGTVITPVSTVPCSPESFVDSPYMSSHAFSASPPGDTCNGLPYPTTYSINNSGYAAPTHGLPMYSPYDMDTGSPASTASSPVSTTSGTTYNDDHEMSYGHSFWNRAPASRL